MARSVQLAPEAPSLPLDPLVPEVLTAQLVPLDLAVQLHPWVRRAPSHLSAPSAQLVPAALSGRSDLSAR